MIKSIIAFLLFLTLFTSCGIYTQIPNEKFKALLKKNPDKSIYKLRFDGVYQVLDKEYFNTTDGYHRKDTPSIYHPVTFFENGLMFYDIIAATDSITYFNEFQKFGTGNDTYVRNWGVYEVIGDTVVAIIYGFFPGKIPYSLHRLQCTFQGIIQKDTIKLWQMVLPYPKVIVPDVWEMAYFKIPRDLNFKPFPIKKIINPDKAWINEFKIEKGNKKRRKEY